MRLSSVPSFTMLAEGPGDPGGGGGATPPAAPTPAPTPAPTGGTPGPTPSPTPTPSFGTPAGPTPTPAPTPYTYPEDRSNWLPPTRAQELAQQSARQYQVEAERYRAMLEAGTGVRFQQQEQLPPEIAQARETMDRIYPGFGQFMAAAPVLLQIAQQLQQHGVDPSVFGQLPDVVAGTQHQWERHAQTTLEPIYTAIAQDYGVQALTPRQQRALTQDFVAWIDEDRTRLARYTRGDRNLGNEYLDDYRNGFINPLRVSAGAAAAATANRGAGLPPAPRSSGIAPPPPAPPANLSEDQIHDNAWQQFRAAQAAAG